MKRKILTMAGKQKDMIEIDGSILEGGGQILRNAAAISCLLTQPISVNNIRAKRSNPGLRPQHLSGLQLIAEICAGKLDGGHVQSKEIKFSPGILKSGKYIADTKTAGSICLLLQAALPCLLYGDAPSTLILRGGTNADMAPPVDYFDLVFGPMTEKFGVHYKCEIKRRGFFPKGGGEVRVDVEPVGSLSAVKIVERGEIKEIHIHSYVAGNLPIKVAKIMADHAERRIKESYPGVDIHQHVVKEKDQSAIGTGTGIMVVATTTTGCLLAGSGLGKRGVPAEKVGSDAGEMLVTNLQHGGCVDEYLQDQLILLMALAKGKSEVCCGPISLHTETAIHIAQLLTQAKFEVKKINESTNIIECEGIGLEKQ